LAHIWYIPPTKVEKNEKGKDKLKRKRKRKEKKR
jgi:hypothetical protein